MPVLFFPFSLLGSGCWGQSFFVLGSVPIAKRTDPSNKRDRPQHKKGPTPATKGTDPSNKRDRPQHKKGPTPTQKGTDPNTKRDRPQTKKGPTPTQKGTDPNTKRDRPQQQKGPTPTQKVTDPNNKRDRPPANTPQHEKVLPNLQQHYSLLSIKFIILLFNFICIIYSELIDEVKIRITNPIIKSVENILILYPI